MSAQRRLVSVSALVVTEETEGPEDITASYAETAAVLARIAERRMNGDMSALAAVEYPLLRFEARSEPLPEGQAPEPTAGQLRALLDEATRVMVNLGRAAEVRLATDIRAQAQLEAL